jgi:hypothetical protein
MLVISRTKTIDDNELEKQMPPVFENLAAVLSAKSPLRQFWERITLKAAQLATFGKRQPWKNTMLAFSSSKSNALIVSAVISSRCLIVEQATRDPLVSIHLIIHPV